MAVYNIGMGPSGEIVMVSGGQVGFVRTISELLLFKTTAISLEPWVISNPGKISWDWGDGNKTEEDQRPLHTYIDGNPSHDVSIFDYNPLDVTEVIVPNIELTELNVTELVNLVNLQCFSNNLSVLDVSALTLLTNLEASSNNISVLDVSALTLLTELYCHQNDISVLDVSALTLLTQLRCNKNNISVLDVSALTLLTDLRCQQQNISVLDVSALTLLTDLRCNQNNISVLDVSALTLLTNLRCQQQNISVLDVSALTLLADLRCFDNNLSQSQVDGILADLVSHGILSGRLAIQDNTAPSAAGDADALTLTGRGWTVTHD